MSAHPSRLNWAAYRLAREVRHVATVDREHCVVTCSCGWQLSGTSEEASFPAFIDHLEDAVVKALASREQAA